MPSDNRFANAMARCAYDQSLDILKQTDLCLDLTRFYNENEDLPEQLQLRLEDFKQWSFETDDLPAILLLHRRLENTDLPDELKAVGKAAFAEAAFQVASGDFSFFDFEGLKKLKHLLDELTDDHQRVHEVMEIQVKEWVTQDLKDELDIISDIDDVDQFETDVEDFLLDYDAPDTALFLMFEGRRDDIRDQEANPSDGYKPVAQDTSNTDDITDDEIQSMFDDLLSEEDEV